MRIFLRLFGKSPKDKTSERWSDLLETLQQLGYEFVNFSNKESAQFGVWIDFDKTALELTHLTKSHRVLVQIEPKSVHPKQYSRRIENLFGLIISETDVTSKSHKYWLSGQYSQADIAKLQSPNNRPQERKFRVGLINSNKNSFIKGNNYILRRKVIDKLSSSQIGFTYAGRNWGQSRALNLIEDLKELFIALTSGIGLRNIELNFRFKKSNMTSYLGEMESARAYLERVEIAVVIENESNFFSEKLTDALFARCHVVYVGPSLHNLSKLPNVTVVEPDVDAVASAVQKLLLQNRSGITYSSADLSVLKSLGYSKANRRFASILDEHIRRSV